MSTRNVFVACGTRPEAIKLAPLVIALRDHSDIELTFCVTGQHREMVQQVLDIFELKADISLDIMKPGQDLTDITAAVLVKMREALKLIQPDIVLVHGDTTTTCATALAAFYQQIPVGHVEAGLRTGNIYSPWPEEANRCIATILTDRHYAPTEKAKSNLLNENVCEHSICVTGNTGIDALLHIRKRLETDAKLAQKIKHKFSWLDSNRKLILVTGHRRENFGRAFESVCEGLRELASRSDTQLVYPVHPNPIVQETVHRILGNAPNVHLIEPLEYPAFVYLMSQAYIIITDSGGIQEEAPSLGVPVLVTRNTTERPEAVEAGTVLLVGPERDTLLKEAIILLDNEVAYNKMSHANNPYGDGTASQQILEDLTNA